jgi:serine/threonine-protein kinase
MMPRWIGGLLAAAVWWLSGAMPAIADCVSECQAATYCDSEMEASGECGRRLNDCYINSCSKTRYGAIAYDAANGAFGYSYDYDTGAEADRNALTSCQEQSRDCKVVLDFWNSCGALAADRNGHYDYGLGDSRPEAESKALASCGAGCEVKVWACSN